MVIDAVLTQVGAIVGVSGMGEPKTGKLYVHVQHTAGLIDQEEGSANGRTLQPIDRRSPRAQKQRRFPAGIVQWRLGLVIVQFQDTSDRRAPSEREGMLGHITGKAAGNSLRKSLGESWRSPQLAVGILTLSRVHFLRGDGAIL